MINKDIFKPAFLSFLVTLFVLLADQLSKHAINSQISYGQIVSIIPNIVSITKVYNTGAAFSLFENSTLGLILISSIATVIILHFIVKSIKESDSLFYILSLSLLLGGTIGNLTDRITLGHVIDFIRLEFIDFPIFNISDISINIGVILILLHYFKKNLKKHD